MPPIYQAFVLNLVWHVLMRIVEFGFFLFFNHSSAFMFGSLPEVYQPLGLLIGVSAIGILIVTLMETIPPLFERPYEKGATASFVLTTSVSLLSTIHSLILAFGIAMTPFLFYEQILSKILPAH